MPKNNRPALPKGSSKPAGTGKREVSMRNLSKKTLLRRKAVQRKRYTADAGDAQPYYSQSYTEGYNAGFAKGFETGHLKAYEQQL